MNALNLLRAAAVLSLTANLACATAADRVPGVVIDHRPQSSGIYIGSPSLAVLPDGAYVASHDEFGPKSTEHTRAVTRVFRSSDRGQTWQPAATIDGAFWSTLFVHRGALYLIGTDMHHGNAVIRRSTDGGRSWTEPATPQTGLLRDDGQYHCAPVPVLEHRGRLWRGMERREPPEGWGVNYRAGLLSVPVDADLLDARQWTFASFLPSSTNWNEGDFGAWLEGNAVVAPDGDVANLLRVHTRSPDEKAALARASADGRTMRFDPDQGFVPFPGGAKKFTVRWDERSRLYWALASIVREPDRAPGPSRIRNTLALTASPDLRTWTVRSVVLHHPDVVRHGFQYPDWLFDGEDIIAVVRTACDDAEGGAHNAHDANFLTFHRIPSFRTLKPSDATSASLPPPSSATTAFAAHSSGQADVAVSHAGKDYLRFGTAAWGPNWAWTGVEGNTRGDQGATVGTLSAKVGGTPLRLGFRAARPAANRLELNYELKAETDADLTLFVVQVTPGETFNGREVTVDAEGSSTPLRCPFGRRAVGEQVAALRWTDAAGGRTVMRFEPPCEVSADGALRLVLAKERLLAATPRRLTVSVELPGATDWFPSVADIPAEPGLADWYPWRATGDATNSVLSLADWLDKPAGKHGRIRSQGDRLVYNGKPVKLWGLNLCYAACAPDKGMADRRAAFYPRYGINTVRLHKFADGTGWAGIQAKESAAEYDPAGLDRMDYQVAQFKAAGIYVKLSAHFGTIKLGPADRRDVPFLDEFGSFEAKENPRVSAPHSAFFYSPELQNLHIRQIVNLLAHRNPHTGLTYAEDPAVCALEIVNEQSIFFFTSMAPLKQSATLRRQVGERFSAWLRQKYGSHDGLVKAWGDKALDGFEKDGFPAGEHLDRRNILPLGNPWYWDPEQLAGGQAFRKRRLLDTLQFLYELQCAAYDRYVAAVRKAGYDGEILGSNWQAGRAFSHYANLHSDARVGLIDRHNYFGGNRGGTGTFSAGSMLARAGSGSLSSGLQQVDDRPFMLSEWIHVFPNEWGVEGPALIGAYAMGLQGWDVSYLFQNGDQAAFSQALGGSAWDVMAPQILGLFPAVARQVLRGDVRASETVAVRNVHVASLFEGKLGFEETMVQGYDDKELDSRAVPARALAAVRCTVRFTERPDPTPAFDLKLFQQEGFIVSSTGQLRWKEADGRVPGGFFTMDTDGTKAVVGFAQGQTCRLGAVTVTPQSRFAAIYVTAREPDATLATARHWLITALARARNTGMKFSVSGDELLDKGKGPVLMEPVRAALAVTGRPVKEVRLLDHDGRRLEQTVPVADGRLVLDTARDRTPYYEVIVE